jgi:hypothetical protein
MPNPAAELFDIFMGWRQTAGGSVAIRRGFAGSDTSERAHSEHVHAMILLSQVKEEIDKLGQAGRRVRTYREAFPKWVQVVLGMHVSTGWNQSSAPSTDVPRDLLDPLETLADVLDHTITTPLDAVAVTNLKVLLREILAAVDEDTALDQRLSLHIKRAVRHFETCIDEYAVHGESATMEAWDAVWASVQAASSQSSDPTRWTKFAERLFYPTASGLLASLPSMALQITGQG